MNDKDMDDLTYDLLGIAKRRNTGSYATQANRRAMLKAFAATLREGGFKLPNAASIKPKHIDYLIGRWKQDGLSERTMLNRLAALRWWCESCNKASIMHRDNAAYGLAKVARATQTRAQVLKPEVLAAIPCPRVRVSLELQQLMGLRSEEAIKLVPGLALRADQPDRLQLKGSWTKGGRPRVVPITSQEQRDLLLRAAALAGTGSLIPSDKSYIQQLRVYKYQSLKAGLRNPHSLRHQYAQDRYVQLTGWLPPAQGGVVPNTPETLWRDRQARLEISNELGHGRVSITDTYLGRRVVA